MSLEVSLVGMGKEALVRQQVACGTLCPMKWVISSFASVLLTFDSFYKMLLLGLEFPVLV